MYKLMIVEDEVRIRNGIKNGIDWDNLGFTVCSLTSNGKQALEYIEQNGPPDVILTDVRMPIMDGLELSTIVSSRYPSVKIIILSGYSDFNFVRSAIRSQIFDYLLKPTDIGLFNDTFTRLHNLLDQQREQQEILASKELILNRSLRKLQRQFLLRLMDDPHLSSIHALEEADFLELALDNKQYFVVVIHIDHYDTQQLDYQLLDRLSILFDDAYAQCEHITPVVRTPHECILMIHCDQRMTDNELLGLLEDCEGILKQFDSDISVSFGIGKIYPFLNQYHSSYSDARSALKSRFFLGDKSNIFTLSSTKISDNNKELSRNNKIHTLISDITMLTISARSDALAEKLDILFSLFLYSNISPVFIKDYCYILLFDLQESLHESCKYLDFDMDLADSKRHIQNCYTIDALRQYVSSHLLNISEKINLFKGTSHSYHQSIIDTIRQYIEEHYVEPISLDDLSKLVHMSAPYISFLFKSITNENYMEYLKHVRMSKAKQYLEQGTYKVYEITELVGYSDYKYFTSQFKKLFGISPTDYRNMFQKHTDQT